MPWHDFIEGKPYGRDYIVAECEERIQSGRVKNRRSALRELEDIKTCPRKTCMASVRTHIPRPLSLELERVATQMKKNHYLVER